MAFADDNPYVRPNGDDLNPYRAPSTLSFDVAEYPRHGWRLVFRIVFSLQLITIVLGTVACLIDVESVVVTGPILTFFGIIVVIVAIRIRLLMGTIYGASGPLISLFVLGVIVLFGLRPAQAQVPVSVIAMVYAMASIPSGIILFTRSKSPPEFRIAENPAEAPDSWLSTT
ncbi:MAG: hypothetical protein KDA96_01870 [Planctomycetaceae bacterium]|nr:hypothetical protein [Planctomycetaceae bacterium]